MLPLFLHWQEHLELVSALKYRNASILHTVSTTNQSSQFCISRAVLTGVYLSTDSFNVQIFQLSRDVLEHTMLNVPSNKHRSDTLIHCLVEGTINLQQIHTLEIAG